MKKANKKIVLVYPSLTTGWHAQPRIPIPMSLVCIATALDREGYDVRIIDQRVDPGWESTLKDALSSDPVCVGISTMTGPQILHGLEAAKIARAHTDAPIVWGGIHPSLVPEQTLENQYVDIVVQGEGEETFYDLVKALEGKRPLSTVKGIWYVEDGKPKTTGRRGFLDLNAQPPLSYHLIDTKHYMRKMFGIDHLNLFTSRGCPYPCSFCFNSSFNLKKWRAVEADRVVAQIKEFVSKYRIGGLVFNDTNFFSDVHRGRAILEGVVKLNLGVVISKINIDIHTILRLTEDDFNLLVRAGCRRLPVAVESGSARVRGLLQKEVDVSRLMEVNEMLKRFPIVPVYLFMMGFPTETREELYESVDLAFRLTDDHKKADTFFNIYTPFPGTELFDVTVEHGLKVPERLEDWVGFNYRNLTQGAPWLTRELAATIEMLDFCTFFIGKRPFIDPYETTKPLAKFVANLYSPLAIARVKNLWHQFPIEIKLAKRLGIYAKQE
jgi:radical SAM superfamily enzyme YgiQ (UPF0313 family)